MHGTNISVERSAVMKCFATRITSEGALGGPLVVGFDLSIKGGLVSKAFITAGTFFLFLPSTNSLMGY